MTISNTTLNVKDGAGASKTVQALTDGTNLVVEHAIVNNAMTVINPSTDDNLTTLVGVAGSAPPSLASSASGIIGWLRKIVDTLGTTLSFTRPDSRASGTIAAQTLNAAYTIPVNGSGICAFSVTGLTATGATLSIETCYDGVPTTWKATNGVLGGSGTLFTTFNTDSDFTINAGGRTHIRLRVSSIGSTGTITVYSNLAASSSDVRLSSPLPAGLNALGTVGSTGSVGLDYSANKPTLPVVGANFANTGAYASYVLVSTVPANPIRNSIEIANLTGAQIAVIRDDGLASSGNAVTNASVFALAGGAGAGQQGGGWSSTTFKGRVQVYSSTTLSGSAIVSVMVD